MRFAKEISHLYAHERPILRRSCALLQRSWYRKSIVYRIKITTVSYRESLKTAILVRTLLITLLVTKSRKTNNVLYPLSFFASFYLYIYKKLFLIIIFFNTFYNFRCNSRMNNCFILLLFFCKTI